MDNDRIWNLIAKKLAGEASPGELKELESALRLDPDLHYSLEALQDMWKKQSEEETAQSEIAFQRHMDRMRSLGNGHGKYGSKSIHLEEFPDSPNRFQKRKILAFLSAGFILLFLGYYFLNIKRGLLRWSLKNRFGKLLHAMDPKAISCFRMAVRYGSMRAAGLPMIPYTEHAQGSDTER